MFFLMKNLQYMLHTVRDEKIKIAYCGMTSKHTTLAHKQNNKVYHKLTERDIT